MPASRSRTQEWRRSLQQVLERGGAIEIAVARPDIASADDPNAADIIWRVRVLALSDTEIVVERPMALGTSIEFDAGIGFVGAIVIGQNRWIFRTELLATIAVGSAPHAHRPTQALRLRMPTDVERSCRRGLRVDAGALNLPELEIWPLLDPKSVIVAERHNEMQYRAALAGEALASAADSEQFLPTVGPKFTATLMNLGGGGAGIKVASENAVQFSRHRVFWMRLALRGELPVPICVTGKVVHTHMDSAQCTYAGLQFDFTFNHAHERLVAEQIHRAIAVRQAAQRQSLDEARRRAA